MESVKALDLTQTILELVKVAHEAGRTGTPLSLALKDVNIALNGQEVNKNVFGIMLSGNDLALYNATNELVTVIDALS